VWADRLAQWLYSLLRTVAIQPLLPARTPLPLPTPSSPLHLSPSPPLVYLYLFSNLVPLRHFFSPLSPPSPQLPFPAPLAHRPPEIAAAWRAPRGTPFTAHARVVPWCTHGMVALPTFSDSDLGIQRLGIRVWRAGMSASLAAGVVEVRTSAREPRSQDPPLTMPAQTDGGREPWAPPCPLELSQAALRGDHLSSFPFRFRLPPPFAPSPSPLPLQQPQPTFAECLFEVEPSPWRAIHRRGNHKCVGSPPPPAPLRVHAYVKSHAPGSPHSSKGVHASGPCLISPRAAGRYQP